MYIYTYYELLYHIFPGNARIICNPRTHILYDHDLDSYEATYILWSYFFMHFQKTLSLRHLIHKNLTILLFSSYTIIRKITPF